MSTPATNSDDQAVTTDPAPAGEGPFLILPNPGLGQGGPKGLHALAELYRLPVIDLRAERVQTDAAEAIPLHVLTRSRALPYLIENGRLKIAVADPSNIQLTDELRIVSAYPIDLGVAAAADIDAELRRLIRGQEPKSRAGLVGEDMPSMDDDDKDDVVDLEAADGFSEAPPIKLVSSIILQASNEGASDIHFLPYEDSLVVRVRVDGILHEVERIPKEHAAGVISRIKVLAKLDIAEHRMPQDGRMSVRARSSRRLFDIRVAVLPTVGGEGVIMRLLEKTRRAPTLTEIGLSNELQMQLEAVIFRPTGAFLVTGPTGSGKSTTVYAALCDVLRPEINVITIEDPVEYRLPDVYQLQVNNRAGLTFATGLRAILRSDPDLLMVGEIRDLETAKITLEAALTGHAVYSTLHTNDAPAALTRLKDLGVEPSVSASAITAVLAQRLVRCLCEECREPYEPSRTDLEYLGFTPSAIERGVTLYRRRGCTRCTKGYRGRTAVHQLMVMDENIARLATAGAGHDELVAAATAGGMTTLWQDGLDKAALGVTTIEELSRAVR
ncbi:MAG TPA: ATPase, T2SS/T4P/T4SS family [Gaiellaceae bacterium]